VVIFMRAAGDQQQGELFGPGKPRLIVHGKPCLCGGESYLTGPGKPPHLARLTCVSCGVFGGWLSKEKAEELLGRALR
jgi:hypothetical protein